MGSITSSFLMVREAVLKRNVSKKWEKSKGGWAASSQFKMQTILNEGGSVDVGT